jgi:Ca2+-binding RTX toxin-like protein
LSGGPGNDILDGSNGADTFHGGPGRDLVTYDPRTNPVTVTFDGMSNDGFPGEGDDVENDIEGVIGSKVGDQFTGNAKANWLYGADGDDVLLGGGGNDHLFGGFPPSVSQLPQDGSEVFFGGPGKDVVDESNHAGNLQLSIDNVQNDMVAGQPGQGVDNIREDVETVIGGDGNDTITGSDEANKLVGGAGVDALNGLAGADVLVPGGGQDTLSGGPGPDKASYAGAVAGITANLAQGTATGDGDDVLASIERLGGSGHADDLTGSGLANVIAGGKGNDQLSGLAGDDTLKGGPGNDDMNGGADTDTCKQGPGTGTKSGCEH